jgi:hypothetical protein
MIRHQCCFQDHTGLDLDQYDDNEKVFFKIPTKYGNIKFVSWYSLTTMDNTILFVFDCGRMGWLMEVVDYDGNRLACLPRLSVVGYYNPQTKTVNGIKYEGGLISHDSSKDHDKNMPGYDVRINIEKKIARYIKTAKFKKDLLNVIVNNKIDRLSMR